ncbi:MAG: PKD domain-containing protein, partial [bacterium]
MLPNGCVGANISFADTSSGAGNTIVSWSWTLGNGSSASQSSGTTLYTAPGTYPVLLTTENTNGCRATASTNVVISPLPVAGFTA